MKAKLQKHLAYKYKGKKHFKHVIIPDETITELCWQGGQELELTVKESQLIIKPKSKKQEEGAK